MYLRQSGIIQGQTSNSNLIQIENYFATVRSKRCQKYYLHFKTMNISIDDFQNLVGDNDDPEMAFNLGKISEKHNDFKSAINHYSKALMYDNTFSKAYFNRAKCFTQLRQYKKLLLISKIICNSFWKQIKYYSPIYT